MGSHLIPGQCWWPSAKVYCPQYHTDAVHLQWLRGRRPPTAFPLCDCSAETIRKCILYVDFFFLFLFFCFFYHFCCLGRPLSASAIWVFRNLKPKPVALVEGRAFLFIISLVLLVLTPRLFAEDHTDSFWTSSICQVKYPATQVSSTNLIRVLGGGLDFSHVCTKQKAKHKGQDLAHSPDESQR